MITVPKKVLEQLDVIRTEGKFNMFEFNNVQREALEKRFFEAVTWMQDNKADYAKGILDGFKADEK